MYSARMGWLFFISLASPVFAGSTFSGGFTNGGLSVWVINEKSGQVALCSFETRRTPVSCAPWSAVDAKNGAFHLIEGDDLLSAWRINRRTGAVSLCEYKEIGDRPFCTPWNDGE